MGVQGNSFREGIQEAIGSATETNIYHVFSVQSGTSHIIRNINLQIPGVTSTTQMIIRDGSGTSAVALTGSVPTLAKPDQGFVFHSNFGEVDGMQFETGSLNLAFVGNSQAGRTLHAYIDYVY